MPTQPACGVLVTLPASLIDGRTDLDSAPIHTGDLVVPRTGHAPGGSVS